MKRWLPAAVLVLALVGAACSSSSESASKPASTSTARPACGVDGRPAAAGLARKTITAQGQERSYLLYVPKSYDGRRPVPVVLEFHGFSSAADQQLVYGDFRPRAERDGFLLVLPDGQGTPKHFNLGPIRLGSGTDDVEFTRLLLDALERDLCIDPSRVYATGMSNGAGMALALGCLASDRFAAIAPVAAMGFLSQCDPARPVAVVGFMGTADPIIPFAGGKVNCCSNPLVPAAEPSAAQWAAHNGCTTGPTDTRIAADVVRRSWTDCRDDADVVFHIVEGGGHTWPGSAARVAVLGKTADVSAVDVIADFFKAHSR